MNGLYQRAEQIYRQKNRLRLVTKGESGGAMEEYPGRGADTILHEIDAILAKNRAGAESSLPPGGKAAQGSPSSRTWSILAVVAAAVLLLHPESERRGTPARDGCSGRSRAPKARWSR